MWGVQFLETLGRMVVDRIKPVTFTHTPPGAYQNYISLVLVERRTMIPHGIPGRSRRFTEMTSLENEPHQKSKLVKAHEEHGGALAIALESSPEAFDKLGFFHEMDKEVKPSQEECEQQDRVQGARNDGSAKADQEDGCIHRISQAE
jgi:hypothetical protein